MARLNGSALPACRLDALPEDEQGWALYNRLSLAGAVLFFLEPACGAGAAHPAGGQRRGASGRPQLVPRPAYPFGFLPADESPPRVTDESRRPAAGPRG